jgi:single-strand DNA-binding protein
MAFTGQITGNLGRDPELRHTPNGAPVCSFSVAVRQPKVRGEDPAPFWVKVEVWNATADWASQNLRKGDQVAVGSTQIVQEAFTRRDGTEAQALVFKAANVEKVYLPRTEQAPAAQSQGYGQPAAAPAPAPAPAAPQQNGWGYAQGQPQQPPVNVQQAAQSLATATGGQVSTYQGNDIPF